MAHPWEENSSTTTGPPLFNSSAVKSSAAASCVAVDLLISEEEVLEERLEKQAKRLRPIVGDSVFSGDKVVIGEISDYLSFKNSFGF